MVPRESAISAPLEIIFLVMIYLPREEGRILVAIERARRSEVNKTEDRWEQRTNDLT